MTGINVPGRAGLFDVFLNIYQAIKYAIIDAVNQAKPKDPEQIGAWIIPEGSDTNKGNREITLIEKEDQNQRALEREVEAGLLHNMAIESTMWAYEIGVDLMNKEIAERQRIIDEQKAEEERKIREEEERIKKEKFDIADKEMQAIFGTQKWMEELGLKMLEDEKQVKESKKVIPKEETTKPYRRTYHFGLPISDVTYWK